MTISFSLCLPRDEASVPIVRRICRDSLLMLGVARDCVGQIELAVTEACTNVLNHVARSAGEYEVKVEVDHSNCSIQVMDSKGERFDHESYGFHDPNPGAESGRGIFIMRAMVDQLEFLAEPHSGAVVHLVKHLKLEEGSVLKRPSLNLG